MEGGFYEGLTTSEVVNGFIEELDGLYITYSQFVRLLKIWNGLSSEEQKEIEDVLGSFERQLNVIQ